MNNEIKISILKSCTSNNVLGDIKIWEWLLLKPLELTSVVDKIRNSTCENEIKELKSQKLPVATISGTFSGRGSASLKQHSGLICLDIDGKHNSSLKINDVKERLSILDYVMYCGLSVGGNGLLCIVKISTPEKHKGHFYALEKEFLEIGIVVDKSCSDVSRLRIYSYDNTPYCNKESVVYTNVLDKLEPKNNIKSNSKGKSITLNDRPVAKKEPMTRAEIYQSITNPEISSQIALNSSVKPRYNKQKIEELVECINIKKIDITENYCDWFTIGSVIKNIFGKDGRYLFHRISHFYEGYTHQETESFYSGLLGGKDYHYKVDQLFEISTSYGINI